MILRLSLELPEDAAYIALVRRLARGLLEHLGVEQAEVSDVETVIGELAGNVVRHAGDTSYRVDLEFHAEQVLVTVSDHGGGFSPGGVPPPGARRPDAHGGERIGGFGLPLVALLSERLEFRPAEPHGTTVRASIPLRYRSDAAAEEAARLEEGSGGDGP